MHRFLLAGVYLFTRKRAANILRCMVICITQGPFTLRCGTPWPDRWGNMRRVTPPITYHVRLEEPNFNMKTYGQRAFSVAAPRLWNKLSFEIRACSDVNLFKSKLKRFLFKKVYDLKFHHICFCLLSFLRCVCYKFPNMYNRVICKLVINDILMSFLHCKALRTAIYKHYISSIIIIIIM